MSTTRPCPNCGAETSLTERFCANCGSRMPDPQDQAVVTPTVQLNPPPFSAPPPAGPAGQYLPPNAAPPPSPRRGLPVWAIILLSLAGLCAVACVLGFGAMYYIGNQVSSQTTTALAHGGSSLVRTPTPRRGATNVAPTRGADVAPTRDIVLSLPTKGPTSTGVGGVADGGAVGAAGMAQTAAAEAVAAALADSAFASATQVFRDEYVDNRNNWSTGKVSAKETDRIEGGVFKAIWTDKGSSYETYAGRSFTNFIAELDCKAVQGGVNAACGIIFGEQTSGQFYKFSVYEDSYSLYVIPSAQDAPALLDGDPSKIINAGDWNHLRVIKQGDQISIFINDVPLGSVTDSTYPTGQIGVSTSSYDAQSGAEMWFDNFTIWELP